MTENYDKYENIFDLIIKKTFDNIYPLFKKLNITPNHLTLIGFVCGLLGAYYLYKNNLTNFTIFWLLAVLFDILDGDYSRKYKLYSEFGSKLDSYSDNIRFTFLVIVFIYKHEVVKLIKENKIIVILLYLFSVNSYMHLGCYKKIQKQKNSLTKKCIVSNNYLEKYLVYGSFFGETTYLISLVIFINYCSKYRIN
jgi:phosphatidylserine synthase